MSRWPGDAKAERTTFGGLPRGELMSRIRSFGNATTEKRMATLLRRAGLSGWRRHLPLPGCPDFVWRTAKVAVFVDGCFWHGHTCGKNINPKTNAEFWDNKITRNRERDLRVNRLLRRIGWKVIRVWECDLAKTPEKDIARIARLLSPATRDD